LSDGTSVQIPAGALATDVAISIKSSAVTTMGAVGPSYLFEPEGQTFMRQISITLPYSPEQVPAGGVVGVRTTPAGATNFTALQSMQVDSTHVSALTTHFSIFVATSSSAPPPATDGCSTCGGKCVNINSDNANCGMCGFACQQGYNCLNRVCVPPA